jgi:5-bromo-4-chloroindolyl phosphate hydrolysis protein
MRSALDHACHGTQYASRVGFREERVARNEVAARAINEAIEEADARPANSLIHVLCECGLEDCQRVLAITRPVYERVRSDPRRFVILPSHLISEVEDVLQESDEFLIVAKRGGTPEDIAVRTDPRR